MGGARWDDWRTRCPLPAGGAASRSMCQLAWRSGCSAADRTITSSGGSAADVPPSAATGAAVEPLIAGFAAAQPLPALRCTWHSAARLRAWRVTGVAIWPAPHRAQRPASRSVRQAGLVHAQREGNRARDPRAQERAAAWLSRLRQPDRIRVRDGSPSGARHRYPGGSTRSATARPRAAGRRPGSPTPTPRKPRRQSPKPPRPPQISFVRHCRYCRPRQLNRRLCPDTPPTFVPA